MRSLLAITAVLLAAGAFPACSCSHNGAAGGDDMSVGGGGTDDAGFDIDAYLYDHDGMYPDGYVLPPPADGGILVQTDAGTIVCYIAPCQGHVYQCGDCIDNDGDGLVDSQDPDCLGACQNNEGGFFGGIPGQNNAPCKADCYWDQDTGSGNDECYWDHECDPNEQGAPTNTCSVASCPEIGCNYNANTKVGGAPVPPGQNDCTYLLNNQSTACTNFCKPLTPNGCDCFGCCENPYAKGTFVYAGSVDQNGNPTCKADQATLNDPSKCKPCEPVMGCFNACGHCEVCFGGAPPPPDCNPGAGSTDMAGVPPSTDMAGQAQCPDGVQPCGLPGEAACNPGYYCVTGCCQALIP